jgi:hypothetical protein
VSASSGWSVADAKSQLSEILRLARQGEPQFIGTQSPCVVISLDLYNTKIAPSLHEGRWLIERASRVGVDIELPDRAADRDVAVF